RGSLDQSVSALREASDIFSSAKQVAIEGAQGTSDGTSFETLATQVDALIGRLVDAANTQNGGRYLFGGTATSTAPFVVSRDGQGQIVKVTYVGDSARAPVLVGPDLEIATAYGGD